MIDHIVRITDVTNKEHERLKKEIDERLEKLKGAHVITKTDQSDPFLFI